MAMTESEALVHPHGGTKALVGTNPIAIGIPSKARHSFSIWPLPPARLAKSTPASIAASRFLWDGRSMPKAIQPRIRMRVERLADSRSRPKGYGLGISIGILAGLLPGGDIGRLVLGTLDTEFRCTKGDFFLLLNPEAFAGGPTLARRVAAYLDELRHSPPQKGVQSVIVPGDRARKLREERVRAGIPLPKEVWLAAERLRRSVLKTAIPSGDFRPQEEYSLDGGRPECFGTWRANSALECWFARTRTWSRQASARPSLRTSPEGKAEVKVFDGGQPEVDRQTIERAASVAQAYAPDVVVGLGGGSNLDLSKAVAILVKYPGPLSAYYGENNIPGPIAPVVAVPTTAGTGSEVSPVAVVADPERAMKVGIASRALIPKWAIVDPALTVSVPQA